MRDFADLSGVSGLDFIFTQKMYDSFGYDGQWYEESTELYLYGIYANIKKQLIWKFMTGSMFQTMLNTATQFSFATFKGVYVETESFGDFEDQWTEL